MRRDVLRLFVARRKLDGLGYVVDYGFVDDERLSIGSRTRRASAQEHPAEELGHVPQGSTLEESKLLAVDVLIFLQLRIERFSVTSKRVQSFRIVYSKLWNFSRLWKFAWRIFTFLSSNLYEGAAFYEDCSQSPNVAGLANFSTVVVSSRKRRIPRELEIFTKSSFPCLCRVPRKSPRFHRSTEPRQHCESPRIPKLPSIRKSANLSKFSPHTGKVSETLRNLRRFRNCSPSTNLPRSRNFSHSETISRDLCTCARSLDISVSP